MAAKIGKPIMVKTIKYEVNLPLLLAKIATSEKHKEILIDIVITSTMLDLISKRVLEIQDPALIKLLTNMGLIKYISPKEMFGDT